MIHWNWFFLILFLAVASALMLWFYNRTGEVAGTLVNGLSSTSQVAPLPTSGWVGPAGEKEYEYAYCGDNCYYVGADGHPLVLVNNPEANDPTWQELWNFLLLDHTDEASYVYGSYTCGDFAETLHNNAESKGIRAAWVAIDFTGGGIGHANNAFNTIDQGLVYIDDTGIQDTEQIRNSACHRDRIVTVLIGTEYIPETLFSCQWYSEWAGMGIVSSVSIQW